MRSSLNSRIVILITILMVVGFATFGISGVLIVGESVDRTLQERLLLAKATAKHLDYVIKSNLDLLQGVDSAFPLLAAEGNIEQASRQLREVYFRTIFSDGIYVAGRDGTVLWREPRTASQPENIFQYEHVAKALSTGRPVVSNVYIMEKTGKPVVSVVIPVLDATGGVMGLVGGDVNPTDARFQRIIEPVGLGPSGYVEVVDGRGVVVAGSVSGHILDVIDHSNRLTSLIADGQTTVGTCHDCHQQSATPYREAEVMAFAPISSASWGVLIREPEREALAPARSLQWRLILFSVPLFVISIGLVWGFAQSLTRPLRDLTAAADKIASGDLSVRIRDFGRDELGQLARSFDQMRQKLGDTLEEVRTWNRELEARVADRTVALEKSYAEIREKDRIRGELLRKVISAQEDERKRIARELHDETSQALAALLVAIDAADVAISQNGKGTTAGFGKVRTLASGILDEVHKLIFDLRPSLLDDLGLLPAIGWYAESRLQPLGVKVHLEVEGEPIRLETQVETALFRIIQEAITNVARHAEAEYLAINLDFKESSIWIEIEDDGKGFDTSGPKDHPSNGTGFGLLGMNERIALLGGRMEIDSEVGQGTRIRISVPYRKEDSDATNSSAGG